MSDSACALVVISFYDRRPVQPLVDLLDSLDRFAPGAAYERVVSVNRGGGPDVPREVVDRVHAIVEQPNSGMNIGAWDAGWRHRPGRPAYLFLQDECRAVADDWLGTFLARLREPAVGLVGEAWSPSWNAPWPALREGPGRTVLAEHVIDGEPANRVDVYLAAMRRFGIDPGVDGRHLRALTWALRGEVIERIGGFPHGRNYGECIAAEIGVSRAIVAAGLELRQVDTIPFSVFRHREWNQDTPGAPYTHAPVLLRERDALRAELARVRSGAGTPRRSWFGGLRRRLWPAAAPGGAAVEPPPTQPRAVVPGERALPASIDHGTPAAREAAPGLERWPPAALTHLLDALPFEHLARGRPATELAARARAEVAAFAGVAAPCRVALLLEPGGEHLRRRATLASWALQTWGDSPWIRIGADGPAQEDADFRPPLATLDTVDPETLATLGVDWVVPATAGDLLHPSLAGVVALAARQGAGLVAWDWMDARWQGDEVTSASRFRAPARDRVGELEEDRRGRAFAQPARLWSGRPRDAWHCRMASAPEGGVAYVHPEPLGMYVAGAAMRDAGVAVAASCWGRDFVRGVDGRLEPAEPPRSVSVVLMFRDRAELTIRAIESVVRQRTTARVELVLVDNDSRAGTLRAIEAQLARLAGGVHVRWVHCPGPFNHSAQARRAADAADGEVLLFLNNDAELLGTGALDRLARWARLPGVASAGGQVVDDRGHARGGGFRARATPGPVFNSPVEEATGELAGMAREAVGNTFACAAVSADAFRELGGLDDVRFPAGFNDVDYCLRACAAGWTHVNLPEVRIRHEVGASRGRQDEAPQKIALRLAHPWLMLRALQEHAREPVTLPALAVAPLLGHTRATESIA